MGTDRCIGIVYGGMSGVGLGGVWVYDGTEVVKPGSSSDFFNLEASSMMSRLRICFLLEVMS